MEFAEQSRNDSSKSVNLTCAYHGRACNVTNHASCLVFRQHALKKL